jgi:hypothetical protein
MQGQYVAIVQKYEAAYLARQLVPLPENPVVEYVKSNYTLVAQTVLCDIWLSRMTRETI